MDNDTFDATPDNGTILPFRAASAPPDGETERMLSDDDMFAPPEIITRKVSIPPASRGGLGAGGSVLVQAPHSDIPARISNETSVIRDGKFVQVGDGNALWVLYCVVRVDGSPRFHGGFGSHDYKTITRTWPALVTAKIAKVARELAGQTTNDEDERDTFA